MRKTNILKYVTVIITLNICGSGLFGQTDSTQNIHDRLKRIEQELTSNPALKKEYEDLTFYYSQMFKNMSDTQQVKGFQFSGYVDAYYAHYTDNLKLGAYQKFPTASPVSDAYALNMLMLSARYQDKHIRSVFALHYGDIAASAWSAKYNLVQEANAGIRLAKKLWLDAGFFRTHLGFESIQPRENIATSVALTTYFEPYYLSGAKLTWYANTKLSLQVNAFNGFNTFVPVNKKKAYGITAVYEYSKNLMFSFNSLVSDNTPDSVHVSHQRLYNNVYMAYKSKHWDIGGEANLGFQQHTGLKDSTATARMSSMLLAVKYKLFRGRFAIYGRFEAFKDKNEILTGPVYNENHKLVGIHSHGYTGGLEYKPANNSYLRVEARQLQLHSEEKIFLWHGKQTNQRLECIASMGVWF